MQDDTLLATLAMVDSEMFWLTYQYEAEEAFADIRPLFEKATHAIENEIYDDETYIEIFHKGVKLVNAETNKVERHFILHVDDEHMYVRPLFFESQYVLKKGDTVLASLSACEDNADRYWWNVCKFSPTDAFDEYKDMFLEASSLLQANENPQRVQQIYHQLKAENIRLVSGSYGEINVHDPYKLRFSDGNVFVCTFDHCE